jgi:hypothetical protein
MPIVYSGLRKVGVPGTSGGVVAGTPIGSPTCGLSPGVLAGMFNGSLMPGMPGGMLGSAGAGRRLRDIRCWLIGHELLLRHEQRQPQPARSGPHSRAAHPHRSTTLKVPQCRSGEGRSGLQYHPKPIVPNPTKSPSLHLNPLNSLKRQQPFIQ